LSRIVNRNKKIIEKETPSKEWERWMEVGVERRRGKIGTRRRQQDKSHLFFADVVVVQRRPSRSLASAFSFLYSRRSPLTGDAMIALVPSWAVWLLALALTVRLESSK